MHIFHKALQCGKYEIYLRPDTRMPMIYIDDCLRGTVELLECPSDKLKRRTYNMQGVSFNPEELTAEVKKLVPHLEVEYKVDPLRQAIGEKIIIISYFYLERF